MAPDSAAQMGPPRLTLAHVLGTIDHGGVESMALRLIRGLPHEFSHVVVATGEALGARAEEFAGLVRVVRCPYRPPRRSEFIRSCARTLRAVRPDCVLAYSFGNHAMVSVAARLAGVRRTYAYVAGSPLRNRRTRWKSAVLAHVARPFCSGEVAVSECVRRQLIEGLWLPAARVTMIPNGCPVEEIARRAGAARASRPKGVRRIAMVSRMDDAKDHPTLLRALASLCRPGWRGTLALVGDGPRRPEHEAMAAALGLRDVVQFLGTRNDIPEILGQSDLLVHVTHTEGLPTVLLEGMAAGVAIVATDIPPCREVLDDGHCGVLVAPRDAAALAGALSRVLEDDRLRDAMTRAAGERVRAVYDIRLVSRRYARLLAEGQARLGRAS